MIPPARSRVLAAALDRRPAGFPDVEALPAAVAPYAAEVAKLDALLRSVTSRQWGTPVLGALTTKGLVEHLTGNDGKLAAALALAAPTGEAYDVWRTQAFGLLRHALTCPLADRVEIDGLSLPVQNAYLARAFETWIHADDIRLAIGQCVDPPGSLHLRALADLHIRSLPTALRLSGRVRPDCAVQVRLTGAFTEEWRVPLTRAASGAPAVTLTADALEFCYLAANRRSPEAVPITVDGDHTIANNLLAVMTFFSHE